MTDRLDKPPTSKGASEKYKSHFFEDLTVGMEATRVNVAAPSDIMLFAEASGDENPVHLDAEYAAGTRFKERIAHGMLSAAYISAVFGMELPGPGAIYVSQTLNFRLPVKIGDEVTAKVKIVELIPKGRRARFECVCLVNGKEVLTGEAELTVPGRPKTPDAPASAPTPATEPEN